MASSSILYVREGDEEFVKEALDLFGWEYEN